MRHFLAIPRATLLSVLAALVFVGCGGGGGASGGAGASNQAPTNVKLMEVSSMNVGAMTASWLPASDDSTSPSQIKYQIHASTDVNFTPSASTLKLEVTGLTSANITTGFVNGKLYNVKLVAIDSANASTVSDKLTVTIADTAAAGVAGATVQNLATTQVTTVSSNNVTLQAGVVAPAVGTFISSADANGGQGYLRQVTSATTANGVTTLQTKTASINQVVSSIKVSSSFKMSNLPSEVAANAVQAGLAVSGSANADATPHTLNWANTNYRYQANVQKPKAAAKQVGLVTSDGFKADNLTTKSGSWGNVAGEQRIEVKEGVTGEIKLHMVTTSDTAPSWSFGSSPVGICSVDMSAVTYSGKTGDATRVVVSQGAFKVATSDPANNRIKDAYQTLRFNAAVGAAGDAPYKVTATVRFDDVGDGCSTSALNSWRESIDFEFDVFVTADNFPESETSSIPYAGTNSFTITNNVVTTFSPTVVFEKEMSGSRLTSAKIGVHASPMVEQTLSINAIGQSSIDQIADIMTPRKFTKVYITPAGIPIVISGELQLKIRIKGDVTGKMTAVEKFKIGYDDIEFGVEYKNGQYVPYQIKKPVYDLRISGDAKAEANLTITLLPSIELRAYESLTGKIVLDPHVKASAGIEGNVLLDAVVDFDADSKLYTAIDADYRLTKAELSTGLKMWLYWDLSVWDYTLYKYPNDAADKDKYETFESVTLIDDTVLMNLPAINAFIATGAGVEHPTDSRFIKVRATATNWPNPLQNIMPNTPTFMKWQKWTGPKIVPQIGILPDSYTIQAVDGEEAAWWVRLTKPSTYILRVGGYASLGSWARQYTELAIDAMDVNTNGIPDWWEARYGLTGSGAAIASADSDGDGRTNLQEWLAGTNPKVADGAAATLVSISGTTSAGAAKTTPLTAGDKIQVIVAFSSSVTVTGAPTFTVLVGSTPRTATYVSGSGTTALVFTYTVTASDQDAAGGITADASALALNSGAIKAVSNGTNAGAVTLAVTAGSNTVVVNASPPSTTASITAAQNNDVSPAMAIANNGTTTDTTPLLSGTISAGLAASQTLRIYDGANLLSNATVSGTNWTYQSATLPAGSHSFTAKVTSVDGIEGAASNAWVITVQAAAVATGSLPDTGITSSQCYGLGSNTLVSCASVVNDLPNQDGMVGRDVTTPLATDGKLGFSYSRVGSYAITECVKDEITGLTWEGKPASGTRGNPLLNPNGTFTNYGDNRVGDASAYVAAVNAAGLCGKNDWRLPTAKELQTIVDYGVAYPGPTIDSTWFPNTQGSLYWSSSPYVGYSNYAWNVYFYDGYVGNDGRNGNSYVRLVR